MNIFKKIKDYDRVALALEEENRNNNRLRIERNDCAASLDRLRIDFNNLMEQHDRCEKERIKLIAEKQAVVTLSADKPEKRKYYTLALQKALLPYIWEDDGKIYVKVCKAPEK